VVAVRGRALATGLAWWLALLVLALSACGGARKTPPGVEAGAIDVSGWDLVRDGAVPLQGTWSAAWEPSPNGDDSPSEAAFRPTRVPGSARGQALPADWPPGTDGRLTYRVDVRGLDPRAQNALFVPSLFSSVVRCVTPASVPLIASRTRDPSAGLALRVEQPYVLPLPQGSAVACVVRLAIGTPRQPYEAGLWSAPILMNTADALRALEADRMKFAAFVAFLLTLAGFFLVEWWLRRSERAPLYVALSLLFAGLWQSSATHLHWSESRDLLILEMRLEFALISVGPACGCLTARELLGGRRHAVERVLLALAGPAAIASAIVPVRLLYVTLATNQAIAAAFIACIFAMTIRAVARPTRTVDTLVLSGGMLVAGGTTFSEIVMNLLHRPLLGATPMGFMMFAFSLAVVLARRNARARREAERSAAVVQATNEAISRFVPRELLQALGHDDVTTAKLGDATAREVTVLFADIRGFTALSERLTPEATFRVLNECLGRLGPCVRAHDGFVDKYIGDAIMALFPGDPAEAVRAAIEMQTELGTQDLRPTGTDRLAIGIGIHCGKTMLGTIGEAKRFEATVISDAVNLTARLEGLTRQLGCHILVSREVASHLGPEETRWTRSLGEIVVKGRRRPVEIIEVFATDDDALRDAKRRTAGALVTALEHAKRGRGHEALAALEGLAGAEPRDLPVAWWLARLRKSHAAGAIDMRSAAQLEEK
jgi:class 3 adenylate cyclase